MHPGRRFPAPWSAELTPNCFIVRDADGQQLAYGLFRGWTGGDSCAVTRRAAALV